jgi:hypothetical protein
MFLKYVSVKGQRINRVECLSGQNCPTAIGECMITDLL